jgi:methionine synthase I (cobalamin-dependent)
MQYQDGASLIQMYACFDLSGARLINQEGNDVTPDRQDQVPLMVTFTITDTDTVVISRSEEWDRPGVC